MESLQRQEKEEEEEHAKPVTIKMTSSPLSRTGGSAGGSAGAGNGKVVGIEKTKEEDKDKPLPATATSTSTATSATSRPILDKFDEMPWAFIEFEGLLDDDLAYCMSSTRAGRAVRKKSNHPSSRRRRSQTDKTKSLDGHKMRAARSTGALLEATKTSTAATRVADAAAAAATAATTTRQTPAYSAAAFSPALASPHCNGERISRRRSRGQTILGSATTAMTASSTIPPPPAPSPPGAPSPSPSLSSSSPARRYSSSSAIRRKGRAADRRCRHQKELDRRNATFADHSSKSVEGAATTGACGDGNRSNSNNYNKSYLNRIMKSNSNQNHHHHHGNAKAIRSSLLPETNSTGALGRIRDYLLSSRQQQREQPRASRDGGVAIDSITATGKSDDEQKYNRSRQLHNQQHNSTFMSHRRRSKSGAAAAAAAAMFEVVSSSSDLQGGIAPLRNGRRRSTSDILRQAEKIMEDDGVSASGTAGSTMQHSRSSGELRQQQDGNDNNTLAKTSSYCQLRSPDVKRL